VSGTFPYWSIWEIPVGTTGGQVYGSPDGGDHWITLVRDLPAVLSVEVQSLS